MPFVPDKPTPGFQPDAPSAEAKPTPGFVPDTAQTTPFPKPEEDDTSSLGEDIRRTKEYLTGLPGRMAASVVNLAQKATKLDIVGAALGGPSPKEQMDKRYPAPKAATPPTMEEEAKRPLDLTSPTSMAGEALHQIGRAWSESPPIDVSIPGTGGLTARQLLNSSVDLTLGRAIRFAQRTVGKPLAQSVLTATKPFQGIDQNMVQPISSGGGFAPMGFEQSTLTPEEELMHDHNARVLLSTIGGPSIMLPPEQQDTARQTLRREYGENGAKVLEVGMQVIADAPLFMLPGTSGEFAVAKETGALRQGVALASESPVALSKALPSLERAATSLPVKQGIAGNMVAGAYLAAAHEGQDAAENIGLGGLLGGVFGMMQRMSSAKEWAKKMGAELHAPSRGVPGVVLLPDSMKALGQQLDEAISRTKPVKRPPGTSAAKAKVEGRKMASELGTIPGHQRPEVEFDFQDGEPVHPTFSYFTTVDIPNPDFGKVPDVAPTYTQFVLRDVEVTAGPGRPSISKSGTATSTQITALKRDTPIKEAGAINRLMDQKGRTINFAMMSDEAMDIFSQLHTEGLKRSGEYDLFNHPGFGTPKYMAPEQAAPFLNTVESSGGLATPQKERFAKWAQKYKADPKAVTEPLPSVMTVNGEGKVNVTVIPREPPRPLNTAKFNIGDYIQIGGEAGPKATVEGLGDGSVFIRLEGGQLMEAPISEVHLARDLDYYRTLRTRLPGSNTWLEPSGLDDRTKAIILANERVTVPNVLRWAGRTPEDMPWAAQALRDLEANGKLREVEPGVFAPKSIRPLHPEESEAAKGGQLVYYAPGGPTIPGHEGGLGQWGVLRGPDTRTRGNWLVEVPKGSATEFDPTWKTTKFKDTIYLSIPEADLRTKWPVMMADKKRVSPNIDMYGWTKPMPPSFVEAAQGAIQDVEVMSKWWSRAAPTTLKERAKGGASYLERAFIGAMHQADPLIRRGSAQRLFAAPHVMRSEAIAISNMLDKQLGGRVAAANQELTKVLEMHRVRLPSGAKSSIDPQALQAWSQKYPKEAAASLFDIQNLVKLNDQYSATLAQRGVGNIEELELARAMDEKIPEYLTRNYAAFQMPRREWAKFAHKNLTQEYSDLISYLTKANPRLSADQVAADVDNILRLDNPIRGFVDKGYLKAEAKAKLGERQDVPEPIRAILGEHKDASIRLAFSVAYKRQLVKGIESWDAIATQPALWSPGWRADMTLQVPDDPLFGIARNGFVNDNPATRQLIEGKKLSMVGDAHAALRAMGWMGQKWKAAHTVYNQVAWVNNAVRNLKGIILSGGWTGPWDNQGFKDAARMLVDYHIDPTIYGPNKLLVEAMDFDAVGPGLAGAELGAEQRKFQRKIFDYYRNSKGVSSPYAMFEGLRDLALSVPESTHQGYDFIDKVSKFGSYLNIRRSLIAEGYSMDDAAALAALQINKRFPNFTQTPDWVKRTVAGGGNFSLLAPFSTSKLEDVRVNATLTNDVLQTFIPPALRSSDHDPKLVWRLLGLTAAIGGAATIAVNTRRMNGISDAQETLNRSTIPLKSQKYSHFLIGSLDLDSQGRQVFYPVDSYEDLGMMFRGNVQDPIVSRLLMNNLLDIVGDDTFQGDALKAVAVQGGLIAPTDAPTSPRADQTGLLSAVGKYGSGFIPQGLMTVGKAVDRMTPTGRLVNPEAWTPDQALVRGLGGQSPIPVGPRTREQTLMETAHNANARAGDIRKAALDAALNNVSTDRQKYMIKSNVRELKKSLNIPRPLKGQGGSK